MKGKWQWAFFLGFFVIILLPVFNIPPLFSPPAWGKVVSFRVIMTLLLGLLAWLLLWRGYSLNIKQYFRRANPLFWPLVSLAALLGVFFLATVFSLEPSYSFWGAPDRARGFLNYLFYGIFALLTFLLLTKKQWNLLLKGALAGGVLVALLGVAQQFQLFSDALISYTSRPPATLGNPIFLAVFLLLLAVIALLFLFETKNAKWRPLYSSLILLFLFVMALTLTRAAALGIGIGAILFFGFYPGGKNVVRMLAIAALIAGVGAATLVNVLPAPSFIEESGVLKAGWERASLERALNNPRFASWTYAVPAVQDRPLLGYGLYNASIAFDQYYNPDDPRYKGVGEWWDTFHNLFIDTLVYAGIPGLAAYLAFLAVLLWQLQRVKTRLPEYALHAHGVQTALLAYLAAMVFSFNTFSTYLIFFLLVGYAFFLIAQIPSGEVRNQLLGKQKSVEKSENRKPISDLHFLNRFPISNNRFPS